MWGIPFTAGEWGDGKGSGGRGCDLGDALGDLLPRTRVSTRETLIELLGVVVFELPRPVRTTTSRCCGDGGGVLWGRMDALTVRAVGIVLRA